MRPCRVFLMFYFYSCYNGFLLDDRMQPPTKETPVFTEGQLSILLTLLAEEKQFRHQLEEKVQKLQNELLDTQKSVTQIYHSVHNKSTVWGSEDNSLALLNSSFLHLQQDHESLKLAFNQQQKDHSLLKLEFNQLKLNYTVLQKHSTQLEHELDSIKQLKGVADLQTIINIQNKTNYLEAEIQTTNNKLNQVSNDAEARKQDLIALFNKADQTQRKLENITAKFEGQLTVIDERHNHSSQQLESTIQSQIRTLEKKQNSTSIYFSSELHKMSNRVAVTAWAKEQTYSTSSVILFPTIHMSKGINRSEMDNMGTTGKFTCQSPGLYLISAYIMTNTPTGGTHVQAVKNKAPFAYAYFSVSSYQTSTFSVLENLAVGDTIYMTTYHDMFIYGNAMSSITLVQLSGN